MKGPKRPTGLRRGQPLVALGLLLSAWVGARAVLHEGFAEPSPVPVIQMQPARTAPVVAARLVPRPAAAEASAAQIRPAPPRPFVEAPGAAPDFERLQKAEDHQLLWLDAVAPPSNRGDAAEPAPEGQGFTE